MAIGTSPGDYSIPESAPASESSGKLQRVLGLPSLVLFGLAYMIPLTVFTTYGLVTTGTSGHLPLAYVVTLVVMLFTGMWTSLTRQSFEVGLIWLAIGIAYLVWLTKGFTKKLPEKSFE